MPSVFLMHSSLTSSRHFSLVTLFLHLGGMALARVISYPLVSFKNKQSWIKYCNKWFFPSNESRNSGNLLRIFLRNINRPCRGTSSSLALISLISLWTIFISNSFASSLTGYILWRSLSTWVLVKTSFIRLKNVTVFSGLFIFKA